MNIENKNENNVETSEMIELNEEQVELETTNVDEKEAEKIDELKSKAQEAIGQEPGKSENKKKNYLSIIATIVIAGLIGYNFYSSHVTQKFIDKYNEHTQLTATTFSNYSSTLISGETVMNAGDVTKIRTSTENMIKNGCPILSKVEAECIKINNELNDLINLLEKGNIEAGVPKMTEYTDNFVKYTDFLSKTENIEFQ